MAPKWERREKRRQAKKSRMKKHGQNLAQDYKRTVLDRLGSAKFGKRSDECTFTVSAVVNHPILACGYG